MGFRFQKRIKILPGVTVNLSKSGLSTSLGPKGAKVTLGHGQTRTTVGLPGTGLSHTVVSKKRSSERGVQSQVPPESDQQAATSTTPQRKSAGYKIGTSIAKIIRKILG